jgi:hypothetical protein
MMQAIAGYVHEAPPEKTAKKAAVATRRGAQLGLGLGLLLLLLLLGTAAAAETAGGGSPQIAGAAFRSAGARAAAEIFNPADPNATAGAAVDAVAWGELDVRAPTTASEAAVPGPVGSAGLCTGSSASIPDGECQAWIDLWEALDGPNWSICNAVSFKTDPCSCHGTFPCENPKGCWSAVSCDGNDHITSLNLKCGLRGTIPESISKLTAAVTFDLNSGEPHTEPDQNVIEGQIPSSIIALSLLKDLVSPPALAPHSLSSVLVCAVS